MESNAEFTIQNADGHEQTMSDQALLDDIRASGANPVGLSADGQHIKFSDPTHGEYEVPVDAALGDKGWAVTGFKPTNVDYESVSPKLRASLSQLPDPLMKEAYLKGTYPGATIKGSGDDWYMHNPQTNQWIALTNKPGLDMSDAASAGLEGLRMVGTVGGALLGSAAAPGAGTIAGAGIGGALGNAALKYGLSAIDPQFQKVFHDMPSEEFALDSLKTGGLDALATALPFGIAKALPKGMTGGLLEKFLSGPISSGAQTAGKFLKSAGGVADFAGGLAAKPAVAETIANFTPIVGDAMTAGYIPRMLERGTTMAGEELGKRGIGENIFKLRNTAKPFGDKITEALVGKGELYGPRRLSPSDVFGNLSEEVAGRFGGDTAKAGARGEGAGRFLSDVANLARAGESVATGGVQAVGRGVQGLGKVTKGLGSGLDTLGSTTRALEYPTAARMASEELLEPWANRKNTYRQRMREFQARGLGDTI